MAWSGSGTLSDPYLISSLADIQELATNVNSGNKYTDVYFRQTVDIDATGVTWVPIGTGSSAYYFSGNYKGEYHTFKYILRDGVVYGAGMFGYINAARIENLTVEVDSYITTTQQLRHGGLVGRNDNSVIMGCNVFGSVINTSTYSSTYVGGICGVTNGGHYFLCSFIGSVSFQGTYVGGIAGYMNSASWDGLIESCFVDADIVGRSYLGGTLGANANGQCTFYGCVVRGTMTGGTHNGGIVGGIPTTGGSNSILDCVTLQTSIGTGMRIAQTIGTGSISGCYARSDMLVNGSIITSSDPTSTSGASVALVDTQVQSWWEDTTRFSPGAYAFPAYWIWNAIGLFPIRTVPPMAIAASSVSPESGPPPLNITMSQTSTTYAPAGTTAKWHVGGTILPVTSEVTTAYTLDTVGDYTVFAEISDEYSIAETPLVTVTVQGAPVVVLTGISSPGLHKSVVIGRIYHDGPMAKATSKFVATKVGHWINPGDPWPAYQTGVKTDNKPYPPSDGKGKAVLAGVRQAWHQFPPITYAIAEGSPLRGKAPLMVVFTVDTDAAQTYLWEFSYDGEEWVEISTDADAAYIFAYEGIYFARCTVSNIYNSMISNTLTLRASYDSQSAELVSNHMKLVLLRTNVTHYI